MSECWGDDFGTAYRPILRDHCQLVSPNLLHLPVQIRIPVHMSWLMPMTGHREASRLPLPSHLSILPLGKCRLGPIPTSPLWSNIVQMPIPNPAREDIPHRKKSGELSSNSCASFCRPVSRTDHDTGCSSSPRLSPSAQLAQQGTSTSWLETERFRISGGPLVLLDGQTLYSSLLYQYISEITVRDRKGRMLIRLLPRVFVPECRYQQHAL